MYIYIGMVKVFTISPKIMIGGVFYIVYVIGDSIHIDHILFGHMHPHI